MRLLPLLLLTCACAATAGAPSARDEAGLARELAGRTAGEPRDCVTADSGRSLVARDRQTLVYETGRTLWVNRLAAECPGLDPTSTLVLDLHGGQYCRGDHVRSVEPGMTIPGPVCILGQFTPYRR
ncbi:MAG: hypothetical protein ACJ8ER_09630 [Allosphingosinicella sp.]